MKIKWTKFFSWYLPVFWSYVFFNYVSNDVGVLFLQQDDDLGSDNVFWYEFVSS